MLINKAIFLDRDGVLNKVVLRNNKPYPPANLDELVLCDGAESALEKLSYAGYLLIAVTNQPDVARGKTSLATVEKINNYLASKLSLNKFYVCLHDDVDKCSCRKPLPGLILQAANEFKIDLSQSFMIGDRWKDIAAGKAAGCKTIWINANYAEEQPQDPNYTATSLQEASAWILQHGI